MKSEEYKTYVGADLHKSFTQFNAQTVTGKEVCSKKVENRPEAITAFLGGLPQPVKVAVEATGNAAWFCDVVKAGGHEVFVAHPREPRANAVTMYKNDRFDARMLATLIRGNLIEKEAWQPPEDIRLNRERLRHMQLQTRTKTAHKNKVHSVLIRLNKQSPTKDAFCKKGRAFLNNLDIPAEYKTTVERCLTTIELEEAFLAEDIAYCENLARQDYKTWLLATIPGINVQLAAVIRSETGDIERFRNADAYVNYTGLVPGKEQSAGHSRNTGITKEGSRWLRWAFVEAAQSASRQKGRLGNFYWRHLMKTKQHGTAVVATAREMARIAYYMMKREQGYYEPVALNWKSHKNTVAPSEGPLATSHE
jgi:transposase